MYDGFKTLKNFFYNINHVTESYQSWTYQYSNVSQLLRECQYNLTVDASRLTCALLGEFSASTQLSYSDGDPATEPTGLYLSLQSRAYSADDGGWS